MKKILLLSLLFPFSLFATNYYIAPSPTGSNTNTGLTSASPRATLANIFSSFNLGAGDTIFVAAGTYSEKGIVVGSDDEGVTIQGAALDASGVPTSFFDSDQTSRWLLLNNTNHDNISINNLKIKDYITTGSADPDGGGALKIVAGATNTQINNCYFDNCDTRGATSGHRGGAIYAADYFSITRSTFTNCNSDKYGGAISLEGSPSSTSTVSKCIFNNNNTYGNYGTAIYSGIIDDASNVKVLNIVNCLFYKNGNTSGTGCIVSETGRVTVTNSTITGNGNTNTGSTGGLLSISGGKITAVNSIIYNNTGTSFSDAYGNTGTMSFSYCCYTSGTGKINTISPNTNSFTITDPKFNNPTNGDYSLKLSSGCIDKGTTSGAPSDDILSVSRPKGAGIDIGAYESDPCSFSLSSGDATVNQTVCVNSAITNVVYKVRTATSASVSGLPAGLSGSFVMSGDTLIYTISGTPTQSGTFNYTITSNGGCVSAVTGVISVNNPLVISVQPISGNICVGGTFTPSVTVTGGTNPTYQWKFATSSGGTFNNVSNGTPANATYTNATTNSLSVTGNIASGSGYYYKCVVSDASSGCPSVTSNFAQLTINALPAVSVQPTAGNICYGGTYSPSTIVIGGVSKSYQWQFSMDNATWGDVTNGTPANSTFSNGTTTTLTQTGNVAAGSAYYYRCIVNDAGSGCTSVTSNSSQLTISSLPSITLEPSAGNICVGGSFSPSITASGGSALTYQWKYATSSGGTYNNVSNGTPAGSSYSNATTNTLTVSGISSASTYYYKCVVSDAGSGCSSVTSSYAQLTVNADPTVSNPTAGTICVGGTYFPSVTVSGGVSPSYQWQFATTSGGTYNNVSNGTPANATYANTTTNSLSVTGNIAAGSGYFYKCVVSDVASGCGTVTSTSAQLTINALPAVSVQPTVGNICYGGTYSTSITATGGVIKSYQWQFSTDNATWVNVTNGTPVNSAFSNGTTTTLTQTGNVAAGSTYNYRCIISSTGSGCGSVNSNGVQLTINADPAISVQPTAGSICYGGTYTPSVAVTGGVNPTYQWKYATSSGGTYNNVAKGTPTNAIYTNATTNKLTVNGNIAAGSSYYYKCVVSDAGSGCTTPLTTSFAQLTVSSSALNAAGPASSSPTLCVNTALTNITHTTTGATGISNSGVSGANGLPTGVSAAWASNTITISGTPTVSGTFNYSIPLSGGCGTVSATGTIIVNASPAGAFKISPSANSCQNAPIIYAADKTNSNFNWQITGVLGTDYDIVSGGKITDDTLIIKWKTLGNHTVKLYYTAYGGCTTASPASNTTTVVANPTVPTFANTDVKQPICTDPTGSVKFTGLPAGDWTITSFPASANSPVNANGATYTFTGLFKNTSYKFVVKDVSACSSDFTSVVTMNDIPGQPEIYGADTICMANNLTLNAWTDKNKTSVSTPNSTNPWVSSDPTIATVSNLGVVTSLNKSGRVRITYTDNANCTQFDSILVAPKAVSGSASVSKDTICKTTSAVVSLVGYTISATIQWQDSTLGVWNDILTEKLPTLNTPTALAAGDYFYRAVVKNGFCNQYDISNVVKLVVIGLPAPMFTDTIQPTCTVATGGVTSHMQYPGVWTIKATELSGATKDTTATVLVNPFSLTIKGLKSGTYTFQVKSSTGCFSSASTKIVIYPQPTIPAKPVLDGSIIYCASNTYTLDKIVFNPKPNPLAFESIKYFDKNGVVITNPTLFTVKPNEKYKFVFNNGSCDSKDSLINNIPMDKGPTLASNGTDLSINGLCAVEKPSFNSLFAKLPGIDTSLFSFYITPDTLIKPINYLPNKTIIGSNGGNLQQFYYTLADKVNGCKNTVFAKLSFKLDEGPKNLSLNGTQTYCGFSNSKIVNLDKVVISKSNNNNSLVWYSSATSIKPLSSNTPLLTGVYYGAERENLGCESVERKPVVVSIENFGPTTVDPNNVYSFCNGSNKMVSDLPISPYSAANFVWLDSYKKEIANPSVTALIPGTYYAAEFKNGCISDQSQAIEVKFQTSSILKLIQVDTSVCLGGNINFLSELTSSTTNTINYQWFVNDLSVNGGGAKYSSTTLKNNDKLTLNVSGKDFCPSTANLFVRMDSLRLSMQVPSMLYVKAPAINIEGYPVGGTFSGKGIVNNRLDPSISGVGNKLITYSFKNTNNCVGQITQNVMIYDTVPNNCQSITYDTVTITNNVTKYDTVTVKKNVYDTITITNNVTKFDTVTVKNNVYDTVTITNKVTKYDTVKVTVSDTVSILKVKFKLTTGIKANQETTMRVFPNPTSDILRIEVADEKAMAGYVYKIIDAAGKVVYNQLVKAAVTEIPLKTLGAVGAYFLEVLDENFKIVVTKKIILE